MIKYSWALYKDRPIHISEVSVSLRNEQEFYNLLTGKRMTAYLNGKFQKHFHHLEKCESHSYETYLHKTAKIVFADTYINCLKTKKPFLLYYWENHICKNLLNKTGITCNPGDTLVELDLTQIFKKLEVEKNYDGFQPDINLIADFDQLEKKQEVIFIEIFVTHKSEQNKIRSGKRIIEIQIESEFDILKLKNCLISVNDSKTTFYNFQKKAKIVDYCGKSDKGCRTYCNTFILYKDGRYEFYTERLENVLAYIYHKEHEISKIEYQTNITTNGQQDNYIEQLFASNVKIKDCRFCKYVGDKGKKGKKIGNFCKFLKKDVEFDSAFDCDFFRKSINYSL